MKKIKYIISQAMVLIAISACTTVDDDQQLNNTSGRVFGLASPDVEGFALTDGGVLTRVFTDTLNFRDLSTLSKGRTWTFPEGVADIIGSAEDETSNEENFKAVFKEPGTHTVNLRADLGEVLSNNSLDFKFNVLDKISIISAKANELDVETDELVFEAGADVNFSSTTAGSPRIVKWSFFKDGVLKSTNDQQSPEKFQEVGVFEYILEASTVRPFGIDIKEGVIRITPPSLPFKFEKVFEQEDGTILLVANRNFQTLPADIITEFDLKVDGASIVIDAIEIDENQKNALVIVPSVNITTNSTTQLSYESNNIKDVFGVEAEVFNQEVLPFQINFFKDKIYDLDTNILPLNEEANIFFSPALPPGSSTMATNTDLPTGASVSERNLVINVAEPGNLNYTMFPRPAGNPQAVALSPGKYELTFYAKSTSSDLRVLFFGNGNGSTFAVLGAPFDITNTEWRQYSQEITVTEDYTTVEIGFDNREASNADAYEVKLNGIQLLGLD
ncbi:hypothetical protein [Aquimarina agarivorans]|uniref:hypothetical protein n=1 Tax=Aquimarina agarivorans TaxID=980584 RepID=UPI000248FB3F|nr:hypothetical protein [Aquimarina agarivorans]